MKMIRQKKIIGAAIGLIILSLAVIIGAENSGRKCPKSKGNFPIPGSLCKSYFTCKNWRAVGEATCKSNEHFNPTKGWCDSKHIYPCSEKVKSKECLRDNGRFLKPGTKCVWYYDCCNWEAKERKCEKGKLFDRNLEKCISSNRVVCKETETSKESTSSESTSSESSGESEELISTTSIKDKTTVSIQTKLSTATSIFQVSTIKNIISTSNDKFSKGSTFVEQPNTYKTTPSGFPDTTFEKTSTDNILKESTSTFQTSHDTTVESTFEPTSESLPEDTSSNTIFPDVRTEISTEGTVIDYKPEPTSESLPEDTSSNTIFPDVRTDISTEGTVTDYKPEVSSRTSQTTHQTSSSNHYELTSDVILSTTIAPSSSLPTTYVTYPETTKGKTIMEILSTRVPEDFSTVDPAIVDFICPEPTGYYPHPTDKHKFIGCVHNRPSVLTCPSNLIYNHKYRRCLYE